MDRPRANANGNKPKANHTAAAAATTATTTAAAASSSTAASASNLLNDTTSINHNTTVFSDARIVASQQFAQQRPTSTSAVPAAASTTHKHGRSAPSSSSSSSSSSSFVSSSMVVTTRTASRSPIRKRAMRGLFNGTNVDGTESMFTSDFTIAAAGNHRSSGPDDTRTLRPWTAPAHILTHMTRIGPSNEGEVLTENKIVREALSYLLPFIRHMNNSFSPMADEYTIACMHYHIHGIRYGGEMRLRLIDRRGFLVWLPSLNHCACVLHAYVYILALTCAYYVIL